MNNTELDGYEIDQKVMESLNVGDRFNFSDGKYDSLPLYEAREKIVNDLYAKYKDKGFEVVSISIDDSKKAWEKAMEEEEMPWQQWLSPDKNETMKKFLFSGIPTLYIVDKEGKIVGSYTGFTENVIKKIDSLFE